MSSEFSIIDLFVYYKGTQGGLPEVATSDWEVVQQYNNPSVENGRYKVDRQCTAVETG